MAVTTLIPKERVVTAEVDQPLDQLVTSLIEGDCHGGVDRAVLPLVAGRLVESDSHHVGARLTRVERAERHVAGQRRHRGRRLVAVDARSEHVQLGTGQTGEVVRPEAVELQADVRRDAAGVLDRELVHLHIAGGEVRVGQAEGAGVLGVGQLDREVARIDRNGAGVAGSEVGAGGTGAEQQQADGSGARGDDDSGTTVELRGHYVPFLWLSHLVVSGLETFTVYAGLRRQPYDLSKIIVLCQHLFAILTILTLE